MVKMNCEELKLILLGNSSNFDLSVGFGKRNGERKPPLCKGRWHGVAVTEGLLHKGKQSPTRLRREPPLHKGALVSALPSTHL